MRRLLLFIALTIILVSSLGRVALGQASIGMSGSFYTLDGLEVPVGGVVNSSDVFVVVYNYGDSPVNITVQAEAEGNITVLFYPNTTNVTLQPGESARYNVIIIVPPGTIPGEYGIVVKALQLVEKVPGKVVVAGGVAQDINIRVTGEYSILTVTAVDPAGKQVTTALLRVYRQFEGRWISIADAYGTLTRRLVPGTYRVDAYLAGELVARETVTLQPYEERNLTLTLQVLFIEYFSVTPITPDNQTLLAARLHLVLKNVYKTINDTTITLQVERDGQPLETRQIIAASTLPTGRTEYTLDYVPPDGWKPGNYTFTIQVYGLGGHLLAESPPRWLAYYPPENNFLILIIAALPLIIIPIIIRRRKRKKKR